MSSHRRNARDPALAAEDKEKEKPLTPVEARKQIDKEITVKMEVKSAKNVLENRSEIYLDSEENFRDDSNFAVVITKKGAECFKAAGIDDPAEHFKGKTIKAKGKVTERDGVPRIEIDDDKQIWILEKKWSAPQQCTRETPERKSLEFNDDAPLHRVWWKDDRTHETGRS